MIMYLYHNFFIYSSVDRHLGCFHFLAIVNSAVKNNGIHVSLICSFDNQVYGIQDLLLQNTVSWNTENFKLKEFEKTAEAEGHSACVLTLHTLPFSPQRGHKTFMWEVPSLYLMERSGLICEDLGMSRRILKSRLVKFSLVYYKNLILLNLSYFFTTTPPLSILA